MKTRRLPTHDGGGVEVYNSQPNPMSCDSCKDTSNLKCVTCGKPINAHDSVLSYCSREYLRNCILLDLNINHDQFASSLLAEELQTK